MKRDFFSYYCIRALIAPFGFLSYSLIHCIGRWVGSLAFYLLPNFRKRTLSNLALATDLHLEKKELISIAKASLQNLAINMLEYPKLAKETNFSRVIQCENPEVADALYRSGQGIIFFCGHQSNWEVLFLDGTSRMKGIAIGKPIKNKRLYQWIVKIREKNGGKIISPHNALREALRSLKKGVFLGIVGDQGMPDSGYCFPFFGRRAWNSTAPALLSYKTNSPIIVATTKRTQDGYRIHYSDPLFPNCTEPLEQEVKRLMDHSLFLLQESIRQNPEEWLWQHNRWKQQTPKILKKKFRQDCIAIILPPQKEEVDAILPHLKTLKKIYPQNFISLMAPEQCKNSAFIDVDELFFYRDVKETLMSDYRFKLIFNFTSYKKIKKHYKALSAFASLSLKDLQKLSRINCPTGCSDLSEVFIHALCQPAAIAALKELALNAP